ncbi:SAM binding motif-containing protein [Xylona heveae TC161]|uniref:SAM binding motif-containing protein n=1 Tax=Xylona heveae (strain CBS 132557 / TC161) TaxID=1328760 RepID=A0A165IKJ1_XYLHT|nr:SAM binding motif-containing protein [Xylona heveae TC161]KZF25030.1 SAM binding motif-containing protein [Xylona heveae TC161]
MNTFAIRHCRRYLSDQTLPYPLPCDLPELHRQNLRTVLLTTVFGAPICSPALEAKPPRKVLDVCCGTGLWSSACHDYFSQKGYSDISFTGLDIAPVAPDLTAQGINWRFVQHDLRNGPLPFADNEFDLVFVKDLSLVAPSPAPIQKLFEEYVRVLKVGGVLECWEADHTVRAILPNPPPAPGVSAGDQNQADATSTITTFSGTPFIVAQNQFLRDYNAWITKAFDKRTLTLVPCTIVGPMFVNESDVLKEIGSRRIAIPFGEINWEREGAAGLRGKTGDASKRQSPSDMASYSSSKIISTSNRTLNSNQLAVRQTALVSFIQMIESLEPILKDVSGKSQDEWNRWWAAMMADLSKGTSTSECLEVGAWWAQKI